MVLLIAFALVAGVGTAFSPCVLPVLPVALTAGASGGRRRPLGVAAGLAVSHTFALVALVYVIAAFGLPDDIARTFAVAVLIVFGVFLIVPVLAARLEALLTRLAPRHPRLREGDGFWSGFGIGTGLGFVYAPCAGPILAGVLTVSASQDFTAGRLSVAIAYGIGSAVGVYAIMLGGRGLLTRLAPQSGRLQRAMGVVMVVVAVLISFGVDTRVQTAIASDLPSFLVNPTERLEDSVREDAAAVRGGGAAEERGKTEAEEGLDLPVIAGAPEFRGNQRWFNTEDGRPLTLRELRGRVVLIDFWTYTCINCIRTFPHLKAWDRRYRDRGLTIVGVHTPEFAFERKASNVARAIRQSGLRYPVAQDNDFATWEAYGNQFWPAKYLIDAKGQVRYTHFGEGEYDTTEKAIRSLLAEAGEERLGPRAKARADSAADAVSTPETYFGSLRSERGRWAEPLVDGRREDAPPGALGDDEFALRGEFTIDGESATSGETAAVALRFGARRVFLVMHGNGRARDVRVLLDGKPIPDSLAGEDVRDGVLRVREQRLYRIVDLPGVERRDLRLELPPGVSAFAFTFG